MFDSRQVRLPETRIKGYLGGVPVPPTPGALSEGYHDFYVGFDPPTQRDVFYGGGGGVDTTSST